MISFNLYCPTNFGQNLYVECGEETFLMSYEEDGHWTYDLDVRLRTPLRFSYFILNEDGTREYDSPKYRYIPKHKDNVKTDDVFTHRSDNSVFESKAFMDCIMKQYHFHSIPLMKKDEAVVMVFAPGVKPEHGVAVLGARQFTGNWDPGHMLRFVPTNDGWWWLKCPSSIFSSKSEYKFIVYDRASREVVRWEDGPNRHLPEMTPGLVFTTTLRINHEWHGSGVAIPVFSLRTKNSWGVGEFLDLKKMGDWAAARGHKLIQILPINDTTSSRSELDSYPYRAISVHALHPMYMNMLSVGELDDKHKMARFILRAESLNLQPTVDYVAVNNLKWEYISEYYNEHYNEIVYSARFKSFVKNNADWLKDYAVFSCIRDKYGHDNFSEWHDSAEYTVAKRDKYIKFHKYNVSLYYFVQYILDKQLTEAIEYLHSLGIVLKGDLPIGVSATSVDAWVSPQLFNLDKSAGAPPDDFSENGQNWGFPTYNWKEMAKDKYAWWRSRFGSMSKYFDAFRIDHILGFFRIWEIPNTAVHGLLGHFNPAIPMTPEEINARGLHFDVKRYTKPYITRNRLSALFGNMYEHVAARFLNQVRFDLYEFRPQFETQRDLVKFFDRHSTYSEQRDFLKKLLSLYCDVLFVEDPENKGYYHPRIRLFETDSYMALSPSDQYNLRVLHDDFFYHRHNEFWKKEAMKKLPALINSTDMLVCGEDLGMVPDCVPEVMNNLKILSLEVQRMPKTPNSEFVQLDNVPYLSVCCTGTHDTSTLREWWVENRQKTQSYYNNILGYEGIAPMELSGALAQQIVDMHLNSKSMWAILPWQDYMACSELERYPDFYAERINDPANPEHVWCWRMHKEL